jgi:hypothetical protein
LVFSCSIIPRALILAPLILIPLIVSHFRKRSNGNRASTVPVILASSFEDKHPPVFTEHASWLGPGANERPWSAFPGTAKAQIVEVFDARLDPDGKDRE